MPFESVYAHDLRVGDSVSLLDGRYRGRVTKIYIPGDEFPHARSVHHPGCEYGARSMEITVKGAASGRLGCSVHKLVNRATGRGARLQR